MTLQTFLADYGYLAVLIGTFLEGETILVLGGLAAHLGYLDLAGVIAAAFAGTMTGDQLYFFIGRRWGQQALLRRPAWRERSHTVLRLLERHQTLLVLGFRFLYGLRTVTPFVIGMSAVPTIRFIVLNIIGALVWAVAVGGLGFAFGHAVEAAIGDIKRYETAAILTVLGIGGAIWVVHFLRRRSNR